MEISMKTIYERFKKDIQHSIKVIAEKHGISPLVVLTTTQGDIHSEYMTELEHIAAMIKDDYGIDPANVYQMEEQFNGEVIDFICPDWNSTIKDGSLTSFLNRRLVEEGYNTVPFEVLDFLLDEIKDMKPIEEDEAEAKRGGRQR